MESRLSVVNLVPRCPPVKAKESDILDKQCAYRNIVALSLNNCCRRNATMVVCVMLSYTSLATILKILSCTTMILWRIDVASKIKTYLGLNVKCPIFLSDFN